MCASLSQSFMRKADLESGDVLCVSVGGGGGVKEIRKGEWVEN